MREALISAQSRAGIGTGSCRKLRAQGRIPALSMVMASCQANQFERTRVQRFLYTTRQTRHRFKSEDKEIADTIAMVKDIQKPYADR